MKPSRSISLAAVLAATLPLTSCMNTSVETRAYPKTAWTHPALRTVPGDALELRLEGRIDTRMPGGPILIWQGSRVSVDFTGEHLVVLMDKGTGQSHYELEVDGVRDLVSVRGHGVRHEWKAPLAPGRHRLVLTKRTEANMGHARFAGLELSGKAVLSQPPAKPRTGSLLFIGDSITVGACNEDGAVDQWEDYSTHNNLRSYGALTAAALGADYRCIAVSGMGVCEGYVPVKAGEAWNRLYPTPTAPLAEPEPGWTPDVIFVNLGENDSSFTRTNKMPFPAGFADGYVALVTAIRQANPEARIVLLRGGMGGGANDPALRKAWEEAVVRIGKVDTNVSHFVFKHWSEQHPRVADDEAMAAELGTWLRAQPWFRRVTDRR